ncbi:conserved hypothetical protein [Lebetimonas natsushimae]|uniref:DUF996 domain-containing protein n=1 Tax=Lebetimonas natsushimae TaxID=1936991 RepID=A0A292YEW1_9BACT|nr:DUF996 domain-containing protein [Lebetimonas natsushimae]GAX88347.1 conserved hypothetical protein [Lebetimonas natsushimae]
MRGKVLDFNLQEGRGIISGDDGKRYEFEIKEWKEQTPPQKNDVVDFEVSEDGKAAGIYLIQKNDIKMSENIRTFGGIGGVLLLIAGFVSPVPHIGPAFSFLLSIVGFILIAIAIKQLSEYKKEEKAFKNFIIGSILYLINYFLFLFFIITIFIAILAESENYSYEMDSSWLIVVAIGVIVYILGIISSLFYKKSFNSIFKITNEKLFSIGGNLIFIGSILSIVLVGFVIIFIGWIFITIGFFSLKENR